MKKYQVIKSLETGNYEYREFKYTPEFEDYLMRILSLDLIKVIDDAYEKNILYYNILGININISLNEKTIKAIKE